jgi:hypothetical protein
MGEVAACLQELLSQMKINGEAQIVAQRETTAALLKLTVAQDKATAALLAGFGEVRDSFRDMGSAIAALNTAVARISSPPRDVNTS